MNQVREFLRLDGLNKWLNDNDTEVQINKIDIKKNIDGDDIYYVWYSFDKKVTNEEFDTIDNIEI